GLQGLEDDIGRPHLGERCRVPLIIDILAIEYPAIRSVEKQLRTRLRLRRCDKSEKPKRDQNGPAPAHPVPAPRLDVFRDAVAISKAIIRLGHPCAQNKQPAKFRSPCPRAIVTRISGTATRKTALPERRRMGIPPN